MSTPRLRLLGWALATAVAVGALAVFGLASSHSPTVGRLAPRLPREQLVGHGTTLAALLASARRPVAVVFWASWCDPCIAEAPALEAFSQSPQGRGRIVGVNWSDGLSGARAFIRRHAWSFPNVRDGEGTVGNSYGLSVLPTTFLLDAHGRIRSTLRGPQSERSLLRALAAVEHS